MANTEDIGATPPRAQEPSGAPVADPLRAAAGALFIAVLPWLVAGYFLFSWTGGSMGAAINDHRLSLALAALALAAFSLWQLLLALRQVWIWVSRKPRL